MTTIEMKRLAKIAAKQKGISEEASLGEIKKIVKDSPTKFRLNLNIISYMENKTEKMGTPHGVDPVEPHLHFKE